MDVDTFYLVYKLSPHIQLFEFREYVTGAKERTDWGWGGGWVGGGEVRRFPVFSSQGKGRLAYILSALL